MMPAINNRCPSCDAVCEETNCECDENTCPDFQVSDYNDDDDECSCDLCQTDKLPDYDESVDEACDENCDLCCECCDDED